jgi:GDP/UDP-N,N'-diacetylbacillosamine 2-epimerase (hydrolysing)
MIRKIAVTTGTRAEYGILRPLLHSITNSKNLELQLIVTGMHLSKKHGNTISEIKRDKFPICAKINMLPKNDSNYSMAIILGKGVTSFAQIFKKIQPDVNLILGDRDESLASALAAYHMNIPNAHIHGGDKTLGGIDEYTRHAITKISNIHFAATKTSLHRILSMGEIKKNVFLTGSPSIDEITQQKITSKIDLEKKYKIKFSGKEILLLQHPVTTQTTLSNIQIKNTLDAIARFKKTTIAIAPNSDAGNSSIFKSLKSFSKTHSFFKFFSTIPRSDYLGMLSNCKVLVGNSSSGIIESSYFNIAVVNIGIRQQDRESGDNIINVNSTSTNNIYQAIKTALEKKKSELKKSNIYGNGTASKKIVKILETITLDSDLIQKQITY